MKRKFKVFFLTILFLTYLIGVNNCFANSNCDGYPFLLPRSQGRNGARALVGWQQFINKYEMNSTYGDFAVVLEYNRSMRPERLAQFYFGDQLASCKTLLIQGSTVDPKHPKAWIADYFGLPPDYSSVLHFEPRIDNFMVDFHFYIGLDDFWEGGYIRIHTPLTHTKWNLNMTECIKTSSYEQPSFAAGYMDESSIERGDLPKSFMHSMLGTTTFGEMQTPMCFGKFPICPITKTKLADIQVTLGWNFCQNDDYHFGIFLDVVFPTGNQPNACYLFEPIVGNGKHWELGFGLSSSYIFWRNQDYEDRYLGMWLDATLNHMFKACQCRSFDFCGMPNSRYVLLEEMVQADGNLTGAPDEYTPASFQYSGNIIPAINYTTVKVDVKIKLQADIVLKLGYIRDNWSFDFGYNLWARTGEEFCCPCLDEKKYALKGNSILYGTYEGATTPTEKALGQTQSKSTIYETSTIDNPEKAFFGETHIPLSSLTDTSFTTTINTSIQPILISRSNLNFSKAPGAITHKLFMHFSHAWKDRDERWVPFLGMGTSVEIAQAKNCNNKKNSVSQWGAWIKGGLFFD